MNIQKSNETKSKISLVLAMIIFGTIGIFVKSIPLSSEIIAGIRGLVGVGFLYLFTLIKKGSLSQKAIISNLKILIWSGILIGANWIFLFESYSYTTIATATLCYYLAPVFIILMSPIFLKENLTLKKIICVLIALIGMTFVSGVFKGGLDISQIKGVLYGIMAAFLYANVIILIKKLKNIDAYDMTIVQLAVAGLTVLPYAVFSGKIVKGSVSSTGIIFLILIAIVHTGICYAIYFGAIKNLKAQTVAIFSYIDPVVAILLSSILLNEQMDTYGIIGATLILGATFISEMK